MHHTELPRGGDGGIGCMWRLRVAAPPPPPPVRPRAAGGGTLHRRSGRLMRNTAAQLRSSGPTSSNGYCFCTGPQPQGMDISELELVQIIIILLAMTVTVVVLVCLLIYYRLFALSLLGRLGDTQDTRRDANGWSNSVLTQHGNGEAILQTPAAFMQRPLCGFQPTYPYIPREAVDLPPIICLPDGEEHKGPHGFQRRTPEQQLELSRSCIRAPPNRSVLRSDTADGYIHSTSVEGLPEQPPPSYSVTMEGGLQKGPKRLQTSWHPGRSLTSTETVLHNSSVT